MGGNGPFGTSKRWYLIYTQQSHHFKRLSIYFLSAFIPLEHESQTTYEIKLHTFLLEPTDCNLTAIFNIQESYIKCFIIITFSTMANSEKPITKYDGAAILFYLQQ